MPHKMQHLEKAHLPIHLEPAPPTITTPFTSLLLILVPIIIANLVHLRGYLNAFQLFAIRKGMLADDFEALAEDDLI